MHVEKRFRAKVGHLRNEDKVRNALAEKNCFVHPRAEPMFVATCAKIVGSRWLKFVMVTVEDLGHTNGGPFNEICISGLRNGLGLCPTDAGHMLRLAYLEQKGGEMLYVAMPSMRHPVSDAPFIYALTRGFGGLLLYNDFAYPHTHMHPKDKLVFVEP